MRKLNLRRFKLSLFAKLSKKERRITIPTLLTIFRIAMTPCIIASMVWQKWGLAFGLFLAAAISDILDGFLARLLNQKTFIGAALDPLADKILIISCFAALAFVQSPLFAVPLWFVAYVLLKELLQIAGACIIYAIVGEIDIKPTWLGKTTTVVQIIFISWLFFCYFFNWFPIKTYHIMLGFVLFLVSAAFIDYARIGWRFLQSHIVRI